MAQDLPVSDESGTWFPSRPAVLPDEMLGALLLPSDPGSSQGSGSASAPSRTQTSSEDPLSSSLWSASGSADAGRGQAAARPVVGLGGAQGAREAVSGSVSHSSKSKDWSLSDPDVRELLREEDLLDQSTSDSQERLSSTLRGLVAPSVGLAVPALDAKLLASTSAASSFSGRDWDRKSSMEDSLALESVTSVSAAVSD
mmetsp:Transcript_65565/g.203108  ORF Transcript_65565/g.203108 Transcript_65565/m.203108 type:complete len:199 (-) Transcript_65565:105-701(-)|eukprot:CAMPEP_0204583252 /NCGR_PEP_ID=MMETSP0661-20131031/45672_1 /ASSEMBLY_ACC=CAM_ASM_000606 /TAXON_ID=109239 /ORGANISM="Alexandrium margalefi, Strain AMGDE01CS-322" /LENGTH=198 /DNA_ID=CAMNT_0051592595 /DNA_START=26 /DNA_END=622 /DNA_ORIENTATION=+